MCYCNVASVHHQLLKAALPRVQQLCFVRPAKQLSHSIIQNGENDFYTFAFYGCRCKNSLPIRILLGTEEGMYELHAIMHSLAGSMSPFLPGYLL